MCKSCKTTLYKTFEEIPQELKDKFKPNKVTKQTKQGFLKFINTLIKNGDELVGNYIHSDKKTKIKFKNCGHEYEVSRNSYITTNGGCGICKNKVIIQGINDIATTHPHLIKYFVNIEDAYTHSSCSPKYVEMKCDCGRIKKTSIINLTKTGHPNCDVCNDGISYPEKVINNVLLCLGLNFDTQYKIKGFKFRYDLFVNNCIIEVHGEQHYQNCPRFTGRSYEEEHENDMIKYDIAVLNGYEYNKNYFVIDARKSNIEWLRNSIEQCEYFKRFDLTNINWEEIDKNAQKSLRISVCEYWRQNIEKNPDLTTFILADIFGIHSDTVGKYLRWGMKNGICHYSSKEQLKKRDQRRSIYIYLINKNGQKWFNEPMSCSKITKITGITNPKSKINKVIKGGGNTKFDKKYLGSYIVLAEEWDNLDTNNKIA